MPARAKNWSWLRSEMAAGAFLTPLPLPMAGGFARSPAAVPGARHHHDRGGKAGRESAHPQDDAPAEHRRGGKIGRFSAAGHTRIVPQFGPSVLSCISVFDRKKRCKKVIRITLLPCRNACRGRHQLTGTPVRNEAPALPCRTWRHPAAVPAAIRHHTDALLETLTASRMPVK